MSKFKFIGQNPMNLRGRDNLVYSFKPGDTTEELATVVLRFPRLFAPLDNIIETPEDIAPLGEVLPPLPVIESDGLEVEGNPVVLVETTPDVVTLESGLEENTDTLDQMKMGELRQIGNSLNIKIGRISKDALIAVIREARKNANP